MAVLAVDDEAPARDELRFLLEQSPHVAEVASAGDATEALRLLQERRYDVVALDIRMPGLDGLELARVLARFAEPPAVVFVTAHEAYALDAFAVKAADYLLKPVDEDRLLELLARLAEHGAQSPLPGPAAAGEELQDLETIAVELPGRTLLLHRQEVAWVEAAGDYVRLHRRDGPSYLVRIPLGLLEARWAAHGFGRIHRSFLVHLADISELRVDAGHTSVVVAGCQLPVSRRHLRDLHGWLARVRTGGGR
jgi:DNA-binding LytR/AlgR family response regulator